MTPLGWVSHPPYLTSELRWHTYIKGIGYGCSKTKATQLTMNGLETIGDVWDVNRKQFMPVGSMGQKFGLGVGDC